MKKTFILAAALALIPWAAFAQGDAPASAFAKVSERPKTSKVRPAKSVKKEKKAKAAAAALVEAYVPAQSEYGRKVICPVMGSEVIVNPKTQAAKYKGKVYYFCCSGCPKMFREHPEKYAK